MRLRFGSALLHVSLLAAVLSLARCGGKPETKPAGPSPAEVDALKKENETLKESLGQKTTLLNQIQEELDTLAKTGETVAKAKLELEGGVKTREQGDVLRDRVAQAKKLLAERAGRIKALQAR